MTRQISGSEISSLQSQARASEGDTESQAFVEFSKLKAERDKLVLEIKQLQDGAISPKDLKTRIKNDTKRSALEVKELCRKAAMAHEMEKLELIKTRNDARNAKWSPYFEFGKVLAPAVSIFVTGMVAIGTLQYQRDKDRTIDISKQLENFQTQIVSDNVMKQRNAIAGVRSLRGSAIPSLLANLDLNYEDEIVDALHYAILQLNEDAGLREPILRELLGSIKDVALRHNIPHLEERYLKLWEDCVNQYKRDKDSTVLSVASSLGNHLAEDLTQHVQTTVPDGPNKVRLLKSVNRLRFEPGV